MLDLRQTCLPSMFTIDGKQYNFKTDFREWLDFDKKLQEGVDGVAPLILWRDRKDLFTIDWKKATQFLVDFWVNENSTPKKTKSSVKLVDFLEDGEYIYSSFMQAYNINLLDVDLHWWEFQALFRGLPQNTKIKEIIGHRGYTNNKMKPETRYQRAKEAWALPSDKINEGDQQAIKDLFYNC